MKHEYLLKAHRLGDGTIYVLVGTGRKDDFFEEMTADPRQRAAAAMVAKSLKAIMKNGVGYAITARLARRISDEVFLIECKGRATTQRVMTYIHEAQSKKVIPVLLGSYNGHQGKTGKIPPKTKKAFEDRTRIAQEIAREELDNGDY